MISLNELDEEKEKKADRCLRDSWLGNGRMWCERVTFPLSCVVSWWRVHIDGYPCEILPRGIVTPIPWAFSPENCTVPWVLHYCICGVEWAMIPPKFSTRR